MAAPNLMNVATITAKTIGANLSTTAANVLTNSAASNKVFRINSINVSNIDGTNNADASISVYKAGTDEYYLAYTVTIPADSTLVVVTKDMNIYLEESDSIRGLASANGDLQTVISYEEVS